jgi:hypothetical protein
MSGTFNWNLGPQDPAAPKQPDPPAAPVDPPPTEAYSFPPPTQAYQFPPTQAYQPPPPTQAYQPPPPAQAYQSPPPTQAYQPPAPAQVYPPAPTEAFHPGAPQHGSAIDSLFGDSQFKEYEAGALPAQGFSALTGGSERPPREPLGTTQKALLWVAGALIAALLIVTVFMLGTKLPGLIPKPQADIPIPVATTVPVAAAPKVGPVAAGEYSWNQLLGTECLEPFTSAWNETYTVVDCTAPHSAQLVFQGIFADEAFAPYPGLEELQTRMNLLCTATTSIDYAAAKAYTDIQVSSSYAPTASDWDAGQREFQCFVSRSSGEALTSSVAIVPTADAAPVPSVPGNDP